MIAGIEVDFQLDKYSRKVIKDRLGETIHPDVLRNTQPGLRRLMGEEGRDEI